jgi:hypothetical protein
MSVSAAKHRAKICELPCAVCGREGPSSGHHILEGRVPGRKSSDFTMIPLCPDCHQDPKLGIHGLQGMWKIFKKTELECLSDTIEKLFY